MKSTRYAVSERNFVGGRNYVRVGMTRLALPTEVGCSHMQASKRSVRVYIVMF